MKSIAIIPARGGSKRIPRKNIRPFHGKPIIAYSIEAAIQSGLFDGVFVSTDDPEIAEVAGRYNATPLMRFGLADDVTGTQEVIKGALEINLAHWNPEYVCCLYATAPMLDPWNLSKALRQLKGNAATYVVPIGEWLSDPGMFYFGTASAFTSQVPLIGTGTELMQVDPRRCIDINTEADWQRAEKMYEELHRGD